MYTYQDFAEKMKSPEAKDLLSALQKFVQQYRHTTIESGKELCEHIHTFIDNIYNDVKSHSLWIDSDDEELDNVLECLEKFIVNKLYQTIFKRIDQKRNQSLQEKISHLQFIKPYHLDIPIPNELWTRPIVHVALTELNSMDTFKSSRDKLVCLLNCSRIIMNLLTEAKDKHTQQKSSIGADDFLPCLIFFIIQAQPANIYANMEFIELARNSRKFTGEIAYFHAHLRSAVIFIESMTHRSLTDIDEDTFERLYHKSSELTQDNSAPPISSSACRILLSTLQFEHKELDDLKITDIPLLLEEYKRLSAYIRQMNINN